MIDECEEDEETSVARPPCRLCGKPTTAAHLYRAHKLQWGNYLASKIGFGTSIVSAVELRCIAKATIRT